MPRALNPYYSGIASPSLPMGRVYSGVSDSPLAEAIANVAGLGLQAGLYDKETDPRRQQARYYKAQAEGEENKNQGVQDLAGVFASMDFSDPSLFTPENIGRSAQLASAAAIRAGAKPSDLAQLFQNVLSAAGAPESMIRRGNPTPMGVDQSYTVEGQDAIAARNARTSMAELTTKEGGLDRRNAADNARALEVERIQERGRTDRRFDAPVNAAPGNTVMFSPGDPRSGGKQSVTVAGRPETLDQVMADLAVKGDYEGLSRVSAAKRSATPLDVGASDLKGLTEAISAMIPEDAALPKDLQARLVTRASELYQQTRNMQEAVTRAWGEITDGTQGEGWFDGDYEVKPRAPVGGGAGGPEIGAIVDGHRFKGGNPNDPASWEPLPPGAI